MLAGSAPIDPNVVLSVPATVLWVLCYVSALRGFALLVRARLGRLDLTTWFDGLLGALIVVMLLFWVLLLPADVTVSAGQAWPLVVPFFDSLLLGLFLAAAAQSGWRFGGWTLFIVASGALAVYDAAFAARAVGDAPAAFDAAYLLLPGAYALFGLASLSRPGGEVHDSTPSGWRSNSTQTQVLPGAESILRALRVGWQTFTDDAAALRTLRW